VNLKENGLTISTRIDFNSLLNGLGTPLNFLLPTFCVGINQDEKNYWVKVFQKVKDLFPPIVFLDISEAKEVVDRDRKFFRPLMDFHSLQTKDES